MPSFLNERIAVQQVGSLPVSNPAVAIRAVAANRSGPWPPATPRSPGFHLPQRLHRAAATRLRAHWLRASWQVESLLHAAAAHRQRSAIADEAIADLSAQGVHVTSVERLLGDAAPAYRDVMAQAIAFVAEVGDEPHAGWAPSGASIDLTPAEMLRRLPALYLFGLSQQVLALAQRYLKVPVAYHGAVLRRSPAHGTVVGPRLWHRDYEDFHVLRTIVYLTDVDHRAGPFEYIPRHHKIHPRHLRHGGPMRTDEAMQQIVPATEWRRCTGPAGTVVLADTARVLHHESVQRGRERCVVMMGHSSRRPIGRDIALAHCRIDGHADALAGLLQPEHRPHVFGWRAPPALLPGKVRSARGT